MGAVESFERGQPQNRIILERSVDLWTGSQRKGWEFFMDVGGQSGRNKPMDTCTCPGHSGEGRGSEPWPAGLVKQRHLLAGPAPGLRSHPDASGPTGDRPAHGPRLERGVEQDLLWGLSSLSGLGATSQYLGQMQRGTGCPGTECTQVSIPRFCQFCLGLESSSTTFSECDPDRVTEALSKLGMVVASPC